MEEALRYELQNNITELVDNIYPTNAPESSTKPYLVYTRINTVGIKTLEGYTDKENLTYIFNIMATKYADMKYITKKVESLLKTFVKTSIGETDNIYVEDLTINNISETWEKEIQVNRSIIDFTIYY